MVLPNITCAIHTAKQEVIGQTPYFVSFGRKTNFTGERMLYNPDDGDDVREIYQRDPEYFMCRASSFVRLYCDIKLRLQKAYEKAKGRYDMRHRSGHFLTNQLVQRKNFLRCLMQSHIIQAN